MGKFLFPFSTYVGELLFPFSAYEGKLLFPSPLVGEGGRRPGEG